MNCEKCVCTLCENFNTGACDCNDCGKTEFISDCGGFIKKDYLKEIDSLSKELVQLYKNYNNYSNEEFNKLSDAVCIKFKKALNCIEKSIKVLK